MTFPFSSRDDAFTYFQFVTTLKGRGKMIVEGFSFTDLEQVACIRHEHGGVSRGRSRGVRPPVPASRSLCGKFTIRIGRENPTLTLCHVCMSSHTLRTPAQPARTAEAFDVVKAPCAT